MLLLHYIPLEDNMKLKRSNSYPMGHNIEDDIDEEELSEKGKKKQLKKLNPLIKGDYKGNPYKISRSSKFIKSTD